MLDQCDRPPFCPRKGGIDKCLLQAQFSARQKILAQRPQVNVQHPRSLPLLKTAMACLIGPITRGQIFPWSSSTQNPKHSIQHALRITPAPATTVRPLPNFLIPLHKRPDILPLRFTEIGHIFYLQPTLNTRKGLFGRYIGEMGSRAQAPETCHS